MRKRTEQTDQKAMPHKGEPGEPHGAHERLQEEKEQQRGHQVVRDNTERRRHHAEHHKS